MTWPTPVVWMRGRPEPAPGLAVIPPHEHDGPTWARLGPDDYRVRPTGWIRMLILHSTGGDWPQPILPGGTAHGTQAERIAEIWQSDPVHAGAHFCVDTDGTIAQLVDGVYAMAFHAEGSNPWSIGIEMCVTHEGALYEATLDATARLAIWLARHLGIPLQHPALPYTGAPLGRMEVQAGTRRQNLGGPNVVGILGHRDNTSRRGRGNPGDAIWDRLAALGSRPISFRTGQDIVLGRARQLALLQRGHSLRIDGVLGPDSRGALIAAGMTTWEELDADITASGPGA